MIQGTYTPGLVGMSFVVAVLAAYTAIDMTRRIALTDKRASRWWLAGGACAMGVGIWSMHFVGMLAFDLPIPLGYDPAITLLSLLIAIAASAFALWLTARPVLPPHLLVLGALVMGSGVAGMHYSGMAAMQMHPAIVYDPWLLALSIVVAVVASGAGLVIFRLLRNARHYLRLLRLGAALLIGASIVGMHYIGMAAASFPLGSICGAAQEGLHTGWLAGLIIVGALGILTIALLTSFQDERLENRTAVLTKSLAHANRELTYLALHDALTKLPNRLLLQDRLVQTIESQTRFALFFIDLDDFKAVNDAYGHHAGDLLLVEVARRLGTVRRHTDTVARLGGDEFVLFIHVETRDDAKAVAQRLIELIRQPVRFNEQDLRISISVGIALYPENGDDMKSLLSNADAAMYHAKQQGRNGYCFFQPSMYMQGQTHMQGDLTAIQTASIVDEEHDDAVAECA